MTDIPCYTATFMRLTLRNLSTISITLSKNILSHYQREKFNYLHHSSARKILC